MKIKLTIVAIIGLISISTTTYASLVERIVCPTTGAIKSRGLYGTVLVESNLYVTWNISTYDTPGPWAFDIELIKATSPEDALAQGSELLQRLSGAPYPIKNDYDSWVCTYNLPQFNGKSYQALAFYKGDDENDLTPL